MRLGGPVMGDFAGPEDWVQAVKHLGYSAACCPVSHNAEDDLIRQYETAARQAGIVIAEVGAWSNPISSDEDERRQAIQRCIDQLVLAERIGAECCVNIAGSRGEKWDGHHPDNFTEETFDLIVESVRHIIDEVRPTRTYYTLETMPWMYPDSPDSYLRLLEAIDRERFGVHFDPANLICSPQRFYNNAAFLRECFDKLGPHIKSCHAKDVTFDDAFMVHINEVAPGKGYLDYRVFLSEADKLDPDTPVMLEHLASDEQYAGAAEYVRSTAAQIGVEIR